MSPHSVTVQQPTAPAISESRVELIVSNRVARTVVQQNTVSLSCQSAPVSKLQVLSPTPVVEVRVPYLAPVTITVGGQSSGSAGEALIDRTVISAVDVGAIQAGDVVSQGTTLTGFVRRLLEKTFYPTFVAPSASLSASIGTSVEAGTITDLTLTANLNRGIIRGTTVEDLWQSIVAQAPRAGAMVSATIESQMTAGSLTLPAHQIVEGANLFSAQVYHDIGPQPVDSDGQPYNSPLPAGSLAASRTINGYRRLFYGCPSANPSDGGAVRALTNSILNPSAGTTFSIAIPAGATYVAFAYPGTLPTVSSVKYVEGMNAEVKNAFDETSLSVAGANGYNPISYRVYVFVPAEPFPDPVTYAVTL